MTPFSDIYNLFLPLIKDYNLDRLYVASIVNFETVLQGYLINAIPEFNNCKKNLEDYNLVTKQFTETLTLTEQTILAQWMIVKWLSQLTNDVTQVKNFLNDTDYRMFSNANNLKEKSEYMIKLREIIDVTMGKYELKNNSWTDWVNGDFS